MKTSMLMNRQTCLPHTSTQSLHHCSADCSLCATACKICTCSSCFFSQEGLIMKPHRAKMGDMMLELLMYFVAMVINWSDCASVLLSIMCCALRVREFYFEIRYLNWYMSLWHCERDFLHTTHKSSTMLATWCLGLVLVLRVQCLGLGHEGRCLVDITVFY